MRRESRTSPHVAATAPATSTAETRRTRTSTTIPYALYHNHVVHHHDPMPPPPPSSYNHNQSRYSLSPRREARDLEYSRPRSGPPLPTEVIDLDSSSGPSKRSMVNVSPVLSPCRDQRERERGVNSAKGSESEDSRAELPYASAESHSTFLQECTEYWTWDY